jgi:hypothetical protein
VFVNGSSLRRVERVLVVGGGKNEGAFGANTSKPESKEKRREASISECLLEAVL